MLNTLVRAPDFLDTVFNAAIRVFPEPKLVAPFPPFNLIVVDKDHYVIELAVAGFAVGDIDIQVEDRLLKISGRRKPAEPANYLHQGIAFRSFERKFLLSPYVEVASAVAKDGILRVECVRNVPEEKKLRKIAIDVGRSEPTLSVTDETHAPELKVVTE